MMLRATLALGLTASLLMGAPAAASAKGTPAHHFKNCTDMHGTYKGGVAKPGAKDHRTSGHAKYAPHVSAALYAANAKMDRDRDGIACEQ